MNYVVRITTYTNVLVIDVPSETQANTMAANISGLSKFSDFATEVVSDDELDSVRRRCDYVSE